MGWDEGSIFFLFIKNRERGGGGGFKKKDIDEKRSIEKEL